MELDTVVRDVIVPLAVSAAGVAFCLGVLWLRRLGRELRTRGVTARATVVRKFRKDGGALENFYAVFSFVDRQHAPHQVEVKVASRVWRGLGEGETTAITYLPDHPETAGIGPVWGRKLVGGVLLYVALVCAALAVLGIALPLWEFLQRADLVDSAGEAVIMGLFVAGFPVFIFLALRQRARQGAAMRQFAKRRGWNFLGGAAAELLPLLQTFGPEEVWHPYDVVRAEDPAGHLYLFGYGSHVRARRDSGSNGFGCLAEGGAFENDEVVTVFPRIPVLDRLIGEKAEVGEPDFRREYVVVCPRRDVAEAALGDRAQKILLEHRTGPGWVLEVRIARPGVLVTSSHAAGPAEWDHLVEMTQGIQSG